MLFRSQVLGDARVGLEQPGLLHVLLEALAARDRELGEHEGDAGEHHGDPPDALAPPRDEHEQRADERERHEHPCELRSTLAGNVARLHTVLLSEAEDEVDIKV